MASITRDEAEEILGVCRKAARRFRARVVDPEDSAQDAALAAVVARKKRGARLALPLLRLIAKRTVINSTRNELVRLRGGVVAKTNPARVARVMYEAPGFVAFHHVEEDTSEVVLAHNPWPELEQAMAASSLRALRASALEGLDRPIAGSSRQAEHARMMRSVAWLKAHRRPFDCF